MEIEIPKDATLQEIIELLNDVGVQSFEKKFDDKYKRWKRE